MASGDALFTTRRLRREELATIMAWMVDETWHVSLNILAACYDLDPAGWIAAVTSDTDTVVGKSPVPTLHQSDTVTADTLLNIDLGINT